MNVCFCACLFTHPSAIITHSAASSQTGVEIGNAVRAADRSILVDPAATVHVATARQVPVGQRQGRTVQMETALRTMRTNHFHLPDSTITLLNF